MSFDLSIIIVSKGLPSLPEPIPADDQPATEFTMESMIAMLPKLLTDPIPRALAPPLVEINFYRANLCMSLSCMWENGPYQNFQLKAYGLYRVYRKLCNYENV